MIESEQIYLGNFTDEEYAAKIYDIVTIQNKCLEESLNFSYTKAEILAILFEKSLVQLRKNHLIENQTLPKQVKKKIIFRIDKVVHA